MAETLPSPPVTRETTPQDTDEHANRANLTRHLDELLEQYLEVLDRYTVLREELSKTLSGGFLSLANAQRTSNLGPGRRYGRDGYDGRMKALKRVRIGRVEDQNQLGKVGPDTETNSYPGSKRTQSTRREIHILPYKPHDNSQQQHTNPDAESPAQNSDSNEAVALEKEDSLRTDASAIAESKPKKPKVDPSYRDPATWYSILVPQSLRQAQKYFSTSVEDPIPHLLRTISSLAGLEDQIWAAREELGINMDNSIPT